MGIIKKNLKGVILLDILNSTKKMKNFFNAFSGSRNYFYNLIIYNYLIFLLLVFI